LTAQPHPTKTNRHKNLTRTGAQDLSNVRAVQSMLLVACHSRAEDKRCSLRIWANSLASSISSNSMGRRCFPGQMLHASALQRFATMSSSASVRNNLFAHVCWRASPHWRSKSPRWRVKPALAIQARNPALARQVRTILARQARELTHRSDIDSAMQHRQEHGQLQEDVSYERTGYEQLRAVLLRQPGTARQRPCLIARNTKFQPSSPPCGWMGQPRC
jgi:hypothetical protein